MTTENILKYDDDELNRMVPFKYVSCPYRECDTPPALRKKVHLSKRKRDQLKRKKEEEFVKKKK
jgi:hypothetical protein